MVDDCRYDDGDDGSGSGTSATAMVTKNIAQVL